LGRIEEVDGFRAEGEPQIFLQAPGTLERGVDIADRALTEDIAAQVAARVVRIDELKRRAGQ